VPQDYVEAAKWYGHAAEQGDVEAQHAIGLMYANGRGLPRDLVQAHKWLNLAAARAPGKKREERSAARHRELVASKMTVDQIAEAQDLARRWQPKRTP
jgi:TPR repeat protein